MIKRFSPAASVFGWSQNHPWRLWHLSGGLVAPVVSRWRGWGAGGRRERTSPTLAWLSASQHRLWIHDWTAVLAGDASNIVQPLTAANVLNIIRNRKRRETSGVLSQTRTSLIKCDRSVRKVQPLCQPASSWLLTGLLFAGICWISERQHGGINWSPAERQWGRRRNPPDQPRRLLSHHRLDKPHKFAHILKNNPHPPFWTTTRSSWNQSDRLLSSS